MRTRGQVVQVVLIGRILNDRIGVEKVLNTSGPGQIPNQVARVVPGRTDDGELEIRPVDLPFVPDAHRAFDSDIGERIEE